MAYTSFATKRHVINRSEDGVLGCYCGIRLSNICCKAGLLRFSSEAIFFGLYPSWQITAKISVIVKDGNLTTSNQLLSPYTVALRLRYSSYYMQGPKNTKLPLIFSTP
jgi:hypothetical protein